MGAKMSCSSLRIQFCIANAFVSIWRVHCCVSCLHLPWTGHLDYQYSVWLVCVVYLSSCRRMEHRYNNAVFVVSAAAVNSVSADDNATINWCFDLYAMLPPAGKYTNPVTSCWRLLSFPQSKSTHKYSLSWFICCIVCLCCRFCVPFICSCLCILAISTQRGGWWCPLVCHQHIVWVVG